MLNKFNSVLYLQINQVDLNFTGDKDSIRFKKSDSK